MTTGNIGNIGVPVGRMRPYYLLDATSTWDSDTEHKIQVPNTTGQEVRWRVIVATLKNDTSATSAIYWLDSSDVVIAQLETQGANSGRTTFPSNDLGEGFFSGEELIMEPGDKLHFVSGASQGAGAYIYVRVLEIPYT